MAIKFSQFVVETSASTMSHIVGYDGADNIQITPNNFFTSFVTGTTGQVPFFGSTTSLLGDAGFNWDNTNKRLGIGTITPATNVEIFDTDISVLTLSHNGGANKGSRIDFNLVLGSVSQPITAQIKSIDDGNFRSDIIFTTKQFATGSSALSERMRIDAGGNVGIGTTNPGTTLDVAGTLASSGITQLGTGGSNVLLTSASAGNVGIGTASPTQKLDVRKNQAGYTYIASDNANTAASGTGSGFAMTEGGSVAWYLRNERDGSGKFNIGNLANRLTIDSSGNVGIGTTAPGYNLDVSTSARINSSISNAVQLVIDNSNTTDAGTETSEIRFRHYRSYVAGQNDAGSIIVGKEEPWDAAGDRNSYMSFSTRTGTAGATEKMRIDSSGNVGIGTTNPAQKLDVLGNVRSAHDANNYMQLESNSGGGVLSGKSSGTVTTLVRTYGNSYFNGGNFGIGTSSPGAKLNVAGDVLINSGEYISWGTIGATSIEGSTASNKLQFRTGSSDRMIINNTGVGIGTTSPTSLLEISKQLSAVSTIDYPYTISSRDDGNSIDQQGGEGVGIKFRIAGNAATTPGNSLVGASIAAIRESDSDADSSTGLGLFVTQNNETLDEALRIDHDGNVGIGTSSPGDYDVSDNPILAVGNTATANNSSQISVLSGSNGFGYLLFGDGETGSEAYRGQVRYDHPNDSLEFVTAGSERMQITSVGNVGIGTTSPESKLTIKGNPGNTNQPVRITNVSTDAKTGLFINGTGNAVGEKYGMQFGGYNEYSIGGIFGVLDSTGGSTSGDITFDFGNGTAAGDLIEKVRFTHEGNVGIGTSTPTAKLTVVGLAEHADNAAAISAGLTTGAFYRTGDLLKVVH